MPQTVQVLRMVPGGDGLGHLEDGRVVFVTGGFPEELVRILELSLHKGFARAERWELVRPSPARRAAPCAVAQSCGGCDWMALPESTQLELKLELLNDALTRVGKLPSELLPDRVQSAGSSLGYRSRARLHVLPEGGLGFVARASHQLVRIENCVVCSERMNHALSELQAYFVAPESLAPLACQWLDQITLRALGERDEVFLQTNANLTPARQRQLAQRLAPWLTRLTRRFSVRGSWSSEVLDASSVQVAFGSASPTLGATPQLTLQPGVFSQVNWAVNELLIEQLVATAKRYGARSFLDLYCGAGNFSLPLLHAGLDGLGIEDNPLAVACAQSAAQSQKLPGQFKAQGVATAARQLRASGARYDLVLLDPPRAGASDALADVLPLVDQVLFYCACDPVSFARDLRWLREHGVSVQRIQAYDMFPQTHHVEVVAWCEPTRTA